MPSQYTKSTYFITFKFENFQQINLKQSPLALLAQTCSAIESNLRSGFKPRIGGYSAISKQQQIEAVKKPKENALQPSPGRKHGVPSTAFKSEKFDKKVVKRPASSRSPVKTTPSPKKQKLSEAKTPTEQAKRKSSESFNSPSGSSNPPIPQPYKLNENLLKQAQLQMQMMNPMHYYMKTIENQLKSSQHVCNWMVNNVTCGKKFSTPDQLLSHLQTHAMTSQQPSYPPISSLHSKQMLQSAYSLLQSQQNQLASMQLAANTPRLGLPMYTFPSIFNQGNVGSFPVFPTKTPTASNYYFPFNNVLS